MDNTSLIVLGLYTLAHVVTFFIQKSQIDKQNVIINNMKTFMDIFDLDKVKAYVKMNEETTMGNVKLHINDFIKLNKDTLVTPRLDKELAKLKDSMNGKFQEQFDELASLTNAMLLEFPKKERDDFINEHLPKTKNLFQFDSEYLETDNNSSHPDN